MGPVMSSLVGPVMSHLMSSQMSPMMGYLISPEMAHLRAHYRTSGRPLQDLGGDLLLELRKGTGTLPKGDKSTPVHSREGTGPHLDLLLVLRL